MSYLLIGLGNPGKRYENTRHNVGKMLAAYLRQYPVEGLEVLETDCYMNRSGEFVRRILQNTRKTRIAGKSETSENQKAGNSGSLTLRFSDLSGAPSILSFPKLMIAHDDLDLRLGSFKIQFGRGPRLHKGILSIEQALGTKEFWRIRIGIDNRLTGQKVNRLKNIDSGEDYVLERFTAAEKKILESVFPEIRDRLSSLSFLRKQESIQIDSGSSPE